MQISPSRSASSMLDPSAACRRICCPASTVPTEPILRASGGFMVDVQVASDRPYETTSGRSNLASIRRCSSGVIGAEPQRSRRSAASASAANSNGSMRANIVGTPVSIVGRARASQAGISSAQKARRQEHRQAPASTGASELVADAVGVMQRHHVQQAIVAPEAAVRDDAQAVRQQAAMALQNALRLAAAARGEQEKAGRILGEIERPMAGTVRKRIDVEAPLGGHVVQRTGVGEVGGIAEDPVEAGQGKAATGLFAAEARLERTGAGTGGHHREQGDGEAH